MTNALITELPTMKQKTPASLTHSSLNYVIQLTSLVKASVICCCKLPLQFILADENLLRNMSSACQFRETAGEAHHLHISQSRVLGDVGCLLFTIAKGKEDYLTSNMNVQVFCFKICFIFTFVVAHNYIQCICLHARRPPHR